MLGSVGDALGVAKEMPSVEMPSVDVPGASTMNDVSTSMTNSCDEAFATLKTALKSGISAEPAEKAMKSIESLTNGLSEALDGKAGGLLPPGTACVASCWLSSIKKKLGKFTEEVKKLSGGIGGFPEEISKDLAAVGEKMNAVIASVQTSAAIPKDAIEKLKENMSQPTVITSVTDGIELAFNDAVDKAIGAIQDVEAAITGLAAKIVGMAQEIIDKVKKFMMQSPKTISSAFKPPPPICCCCCCGASEACNKLQETLESVANAVNLDPLLEIVNKFKTTLEGIDFKKLSQLLSHCKFLLKQAFTAAKEAAEKLAGGAESAEALRDAAGAADAPEMPGISSIS